MKSHGNAKASVTNFSMISLNDYQTVKNFGHIQYLVEFVNLCLEEIDELKREQSCFRCKMTYYFVRCSVTICCKGSVDCV